MRINELSIVLKDQAPRPAPSGPGDDATHTEDMVTALWTSQLWCYCSACDDFAWALFVMLEILCEQMKLDVLESCSESLAVPCGLVSTAISSPFYNIDCNGQTQLH